MSELTGTTRLGYPDGSAEIYAVWRDALGTFAAIHDETGAVIVRPTGFAYVPALTREQVQQALEHPARELARKGAAVKPELAGRMEKAADLVESGQVQLLSDSWAKCHGYSVTPTACGCKDFQFNGGWCKHRLAVRMARSLEQPLEPEAAPQPRIQPKRQPARRRAGRPSVLEAIYAAEGVQRIDDGLSAAEIAYRDEQEAKREQASAQAARQAAARRSNMTQEARQARTDSLGAERWAWKHYANGKTSLPAEFYERIHGK